MSHCDLLMFGLGVPVVGVDSHGVIPPAGFFPAPDFRGYFLINRIVQRSQREIQIGRLPVDELQRRAADPAKRSGNVF